jgi:glutamate decarboxylase
MPTFALNFSRPAGQIVAQYYNFLRLGREGYARVHKSCYDTARYLADEIAGMGTFRIIFDGDMKAGIPAISWTLKSDTGYTLYDFADRLRSRCRSATGRRHPLGPRVSQRSAGPPSADYASRTAGTVRD